MGSSLVIYPLRRSEQIGKTLIAPLDKLLFDSDYRIFSQLRAWPDYPEPTIRPRELLPHSFVYLQTDEGWEKTRENPYGEELTFSFAHELQKLHIPLDTSDHNKAIKAFIDALPKYVPIILEWR